MSLDRREALTLFADRVSAYNASVRRVGRQDLPAELGRVLESRGITRLAVPSDLPEEWVQEVPASSTEILVDGRVEAPSSGADPHSLSLGRLAASDGVLTGCALGIAQTGTIVLDGGAAQGRRALTLLPDYHLCVVFGRQVVESVSEAVDLLAAEVRKRRAPITLISGPSATSDIELTRVEGVHGPRTLDVILVEES